MNSEPSNLASQPLFTMNLQLFPIYCADRSAKADAAPGSLETVQRQRPRLTSIQVKGLTVDAIDFDAVRRIFRIGSLTPLQPERLARRSSFTTLFLQRRAM
jgi:hypothetical protein